MLTIDNYFEFCKKVDFNKLPEALKNGDNLTRGASANSWSAYHSNENIRRVVHAFFKKLEEYLKKNPQKETKTNVKVENKKVKVEMKKAEPKEEKKQKNESKPEKEAEQVEKIIPEVQFIKRYIAMNGKIKTEEEILRFINSLQKAILEKRIRKTSKYAKEIAHIQEQLIRCYEKMGDSIQISVAEGTLKEYSLIAQSQKGMLSVSYIRQYISLHGKKDVMEKAKALSDKIEKAVINKKILKSDAYSEKLNLIYKSLNKYVKGESPTPVISPAALNGLMGIAGYRQKKSAELNGIEEKRALPEVIPSADLAKMNFETIGLQGKYRELIGDPSVGFTAMVYGLPKSGKSTLCIDFAKYLAEHHGTVLYVAIEEGFGFTLKEKLERLHAMHPNLFVSETIPEDLSRYDFVFIDSVSRANLDMEVLRKLHEAFPKTAFIFIFHTTKEGNFRGKNENAHEVDVIIEVANGKAKGNGRFGVGGEIDVFEKKEAS